jgi:hypothetical protein
MAAIEYLSHSSLEDVRSCSLKWKLRKLDKVPSRPGWSLVGGNAVHRVTEAIDRRDFGCRLSRQTWTSPQCSISS